LSLFNELKRRNVIRVSMAYLAGAWLILQVADTVIPWLELGDAVGRILLRDRYVDVRVDAGRHPFR
jgi:hypothetical protein